MRAQQGVQCLCMLAHNWAESVLCACQVPTVDGDVDLKIPAGVQPGTTLVMGKRGVPRLGSTGRGDHLVRLIPCGSCAGGLNCSWCCAWAAAALTCLPAAMF